MPQSPLGRQTIEGVRVCIRSPMASNDIDDSPQRIDDWRLAVHHSERLAIVNPDPHFETRLSGGGIVHHSADFEADDLAADDSVFDDELGSALDDQIAELEMGRMRLGLRSELLDRCRRDLSVLDVPHADVDREMRCTSGECSGAFRGEQVEPLRSFALHPRQTDTERSILASLDENPCLVASDDGGSDTDLIGLPEFCR